MNLWHDVPLGDDAPNEINVIIEIPKGSHNKYEIDKETGLIKLDRANYSAAAYPCEYAFAPQTYAEDGDAIDVLILSTFPIPPGILVKARPVAFMEMSESFLQSVVQAVAAVAEPMYTRNILPIPAAAVVVAVVHW